MLRVMNGKLQHCKKSWSECEILLYARRRRVIVEREMKASCCPAAAKKGKSVSTGVLKPRLQHVTCECNLLVAISGRTSHCNQCAKVSKPEKKGEKKKRNFLFNRTCLWILNRSEKNLTEIWLNFTQNAAVHAREPANAKTIKKKKLNPRTALFMVHSACTHGSLFNLQTCSELEFTTGTESRLHDDQNILVLSPGIKVIKISLIVIKPHGSQWAILSQLCVNSKGVR